MSVDQCSNSFVDDWDATLESGNHGVGSAKYSHAREWYRKGWHAALNQGAQKPTTNKPSAKCAHRWLPVDGMLTVRNAEICIKCHAGRTSRVG